jgi:hypothetical protein
MTFIRSHRSAVKHRVAANRRGTQVFSRFTLLELILHFHIGPGHRYSFRFLSVTLRIWEKNRESNWEQEVVRLLEVMTQQLGASMLRLCPSKMTKEAAAVLCQQT